MFARAVRIATVRGIEVRLDPSLGLLAVLLGWLLFVRFSSPFGTPTAAAMAAAGSLLFFASILAHELAHALEARHRDIDVKAITLLLFGGVTEMHSESQRPRDEFVVAAVGPYISLVCAAVFHLVASGAARALPPAAAAPIVDLGLLLAYLNVLLAVFNLVPGAPLDGGRVLRAGLWWVWKDRRRAVRGAARAGQAFGLVVIAVGVFELTVGLRLAALGGIWWIVIGVFLLRAATAELRRTEAQVAMDGRTARDALGELPVLLDRDQPLELVPLDQLAADHVLVGGDHPGELSGWIPVHELAALHPTDRSVRTAGDLAVPIAGLPAVAIDAPLTDVVQRFVDGARRLRVQDGDATVAILTERRTAEALRTLHGDGRPHPGGRSVPASRT